MNQKVAAYLELAKLRIVTLVLVMTGLGFLLGSRSSIDGWRLLLTLVGTGMTAAGGAAINNYLERDIDCKMLRTAQRVIPRGVIAPFDALTFGVVLVLLGTTLLSWQVNLLTGFLALLTAFLYVFVYTPLKRVTWLNTCVGAIPGALPPVGGWAASAGHLELGAWALFLILFLWQHPHFYAIAWMYRDDYERGGLKMLPTLDPDGSRTFRQIIFFSLLLIPASIIPSLIGISGGMYAFGAFAAGLVMLYGGIVLARNGSIHSARRLLRLSIVYLPSLFILILADSGIG